jgi:hypothetical protein
VHSHAQARTHAEAHMPPRATPAFMPNRRMTCARSYPPTTEPPGESKTTAAIFLREGPSLLSRLTPSWGFRSNTAARTRDRGLFRTGARSTS